MKPQKVSAKEVGQALGEVAAVMCVLVLAVVLGLAFGWVCLRIVVPMFWE